MNKKALIALTLILAIMMFATGINSVFALEIYEHQYAGGVAEAVQVPCGPQINFVMYRLCGDFGRVSDRFHIAVATESDPETFEVVRGWEDNPERKAFSDNLPYGDNILVNRRQIQVVKIFKTTIAWWTIPLVVPETDDTQGFTVPPGFLILKGSGEKITAFTEIPGVVTVDTKANYEAEGKMWCAGWGSQSIAGTVVTDTDWLWTLPDP